MNRVLVLGLIANGAPAMVPLAFNGSASPSQKYNHFFSSAGVDCRIPIVWQLFKKNTLQKQGNIFRQNGMVYGLIALDACGFLADKASKRG